MLLALVEMCISGQIGVKIKLPRTDISPHEYLFGEDQSRYLIEINEKNKNKVSKILDKNGIYYELIGRTQKDSLDLDKEFSIKISDLNELNTLWFKNYFMEG